MGISLRELIKKTERGGKEIERGEGEEVRALRRRRTARRSVPLSKH